MHNEQLIVVILIIVLLHIYTWLDDSIIRYVMLDNTLIFSGRWASVTKRWPINHSVPYKLGSNPVRGKRLDCLEQAIVCPDPST